MRKNALILLIFIAFVTGCSVLLLKYKPVEISKIYHTLIGSKNKTIVADPGDPPPEQGGEAGSSGTWTEIPDKRNRTSKTYQSSEDPRKFSWDGTLATINYESTIDSGNYDTPVDMTPVRVNNAQLDGWLITQAGWHYALGQPSDKQTDGWVGFGGRKGQNWFKFRLARVGYLHWPTRAWDDIGGAPTYSRANLSSQVHSIPFGPNNEQLPVESVAAWENIWSTPGGGALDISWRVNADQLKEEVTINQEARTWITNNRAPSNPLDETWFGFVFQLDWSDVPKIYRAGILKNTSDDFADDNENIELKDATDRLLAFMPLSDAWVNDANGEEIEGSRTQLRKRFYQDGGNTYLLVGLRTDTIASLPNGDLIIDPTVDYQVGAGADDWGVAGNFYASGQHWFGDGGDIGSRYPAVTISAGATIDVAYLSMRAYYTNSTTTVNARISGNDADNPAAPTTAAGHNGLALTTLYADWANFGSWSAGTWYNSPSLVAPCQELVNTYSYAAGAAMIWLTKNNGSSASAGRTVYDHSNGASSAPKLHIEYTEATPTPTPAPGDGNDFNFEGLDMEGLDIN